MEEEKQAFEITDLSSLTWVFREILSPLNKKVEENKRVAKEQIEHINQWLESENKSAISEIEYWSKRVEDYHTLSLLSDPKCKTLSTPFGKNKSTTSKPQPELADADKLLSYAKSNELNDLIKVEESVRWGEMKKILKVNGDNVVDANGEIVEGVKVKPETTTFKMEVL